MRFPIFSKIVILSFVSFLLAACGQDGPSEDEILQAAKKDLTSTANSLEAIEAFDILKLARGNSAALRAIEVEDVEIQAVSNVGTEASPIWETRSVLTLSLKDDLVRPSTITRRVDRQFFGPRDVTEPLVILGHNIVERALPKGEEFQTVLTTRATPLVEGFKVRIVNLGDEMPNLSGLLPLTSLNDAVFLDSKEHLALVEEEKRQQAAAEETARLAQEKAQEAHRLEVAKLNKKYMGRYVSEQPAFVDGTYAYSRDSRLGVEFEIPESDKDFGTTTIKIYDFDHPNIELAFPATFTVSSDLSTYILVAAERAESVTMGLTVDTDDTWQLNSPSELQYQAMFAQTKLFLITRDAQKIAEKEKLKSASAKQMALAQSLMAKHKAREAEDTFRELRLNRQTYSFYSVVGSAKSDRLYGTEGYTADSDIAAAAVHAGVLKEGQFGIVKISHWTYKNNGRIPLQGSTQNGVTSQTPNYSPRDAYGIELVEALPIKGTENAR